MKKIRLAAFILIILCCICALCACSNKSEITSNGITSVEVKGSGDNREVKIKVELTDEFVNDFKGQKIYLIAKSGGELSSYKPIAEEKVKNKVTFEIPYEENGKNHSGTGFVCAVISGEGDERQFTPIDTCEKYITNTSKLGSDASRPSTSSIKGLATTDIGHAGYLGAEHIMLDIRIDKILLEGYAENSVSYISDAHTYYFNGEYIEELDKTISQATKTGKKVYLQLLLGKPELDEDGYPAWDEIECLYFSGASNNSYYYLPDMSNAEAYGYLRALFGMLGERYSGSNGVAIDWIMGKNANISSYSDAGKCEIADARTYYHQYVRLAYNTLSCIASNAKVYVSVDHSNYMQSLAFMNTFNMNAKDGGDFPWGMAFSYGDISGEGVWSDSDEYSDRFTAGSLTTLKAYLDNDFKYGSDRRSVIISNLSLKLNSESEGSDSARAASYAYLYYATASSGIVDALIYSSYQNDSRGLFTADGEHTALSDTFAKCASNKAGELDAVLKSTIGSKWTSLSESDAFDSISVYYGGLVDKTVNTSSSKRMIDFSSGSIYGFSPLGDAKYASLTEYYTGDNQTPVTYLRFGGDDSQWRVLYTTLEKTQLKNSRYLGITANSETSGDSLSIIITGTDKKTKSKISYCATAEISSEYKEYIFDLSDFTDRLQDGDISVAICTPKGQSSEISLHAFKLYGSSGGQVWKYIIIILIIVVITAALVIVARLLNNNSSKKRKKHKKHSGNSKNKAPNKKSDAKSQAKPKPQEKNEDKAEVDDEDDEDDEDEEIITRAPKNKPQDEEEELVEPEDFEEEYILEGDEEE